MLNITFKNVLGSVNICGGDNPLCALLWVTGLSLPLQKETAIRYAGVAGQRVTEVTDLARDIRLKGHGYGDIQQLGKALKVLYTPGKLIFTTDRGVKTIDARCLGVTDRSQTEQGVYELEFSFRCDNPYFRDIASVLCDVYQRRGILSTYFTLPCMLSERINEGVCQNTGDIPAEPTVTVENRGTATVSGFQIRNRTTGKSIIYTGSVAPGEQITISVPERTIQNSAGTDCLVHLAPDCYLSEFTLPVGENRFVFTADNGLWCHLQFDAGYVQNLV